MKSISKAVQLKKRSLISMTAFRVFLPLFVSISAIIFAFYGTGSRSIWLDEATSVLVSNSGFDNLPENLKKPGTPPLYYLLLAGWIRIFGISEIAVRSLSSVFYLASLTCIFFLGNLLFKRKSIAPLVCVLLYMISPLAVRHAQSARPYSLLVFLVILSLFSFFQMAKTGFRFDRIAVLFILINSLGYFTHYWFAFFVFAEFISFCLLFFSLAAIRNFIVFNILAIIPFWIFWVPVIIWQLGTGMESSLGPPSGSAIYETILDFYGGGFTGLFLICSFFLLPVLYIKNQSIHIRKIRSISNYFRRKESRILLLIFALSLMVPFIFSQIKPLFVVGRYTVIILPMYVLITGGILSRSLNPSILISILVMLTIVSIVFFIRHRQQGDPRPDRAAAQYILDQARKNDIILYTSLSRGAIDYYLQLNKREHDFEQITFPLEISEHVSWMDSKKLLTNRLLLESEAEKIIMELKKKTEEKKSVWVFYGKDPEISLIIMKRIENNFSLIQKADVPGPFHDSIYQFVKK